MARLDWRASGFCLRNLGGGAALAPGELAPKAPEPNPRLPLQKAPSQPICAPLEGRAGVRHPSRPHRNDMRWPWGLTLWLLSISACWDGCAAAAVRRDAAADLSDSAVPDGVSPFLRKRGVGWGLNATHIRTLAGLSWWYKWGPSVRDPETTRAAAAVGMRFVPEQVGAAEQARAATTFSKCALAHLPAALDPCCAVGPWGYR